MTNTTGPIRTAREVENAVQAHPDLELATVLGLPDHGWGELVCAVVLRKPGRTLDEAALLRFCGERLAGYKKPRRVVFMDAMPLTAAGKVRKAELRRLLAQRATL